MIYWNVRPEAVALGPITIRWYGLFFASAFLAGFQVMRRLFAADGVSGEILDPLILYVALGTVIGARLGHCLFYEPDIFLADPLRILRIWEGGLASHGAAIGILLSMLLFCRRHGGSLPDPPGASRRKPPAPGADPRKFDRKYIKFKMVWLLDRLTMPVILGGALIRIGNFFNSEIIGKPSNLPWAVIFARVSPIPRHPAQLYESIAYFAIFGLLYRLFWRKPLRDATGFLFGVFLTLVFGLRFLIEFAKENQVGFESKLPLDLGQLLSIPLVLAGLYFMFRKSASSRSHPAR